MLPDPRDYALEITSELMHAPKSGNDSMKHNVCHLLRRKNKWSKNKDKRSPSAAPSFFTKSCLGWTLQRHRGITPWSPRGTYTQHCFRPEAADHFCLLVLVSLHCCNETLWPEAIWRRNSLFGLYFCVITPSVKKVKTGNQSKACKIQLAAFLIWPRQTCLGMVPPTMGYTFPCQPPVQTVLHKHGHCLWSLRWLWAISSWS